LAPAFAVCVADFNGDGHEDVFFCQNFYATRAETSRYDAGRGLLLHGDGRGGFMPVAGQQSGLLMHGEQRGAAAGDYDGDGRTDLAVSQLSETKLYRNVTARPGLRVRIQGAKGNPLGVGAVLRMRSGGREGPAREIHAGSGYWSQDSAVQVMAFRPGPPTTLRVQWPGGKATESQVPPEALEVTVDPDGDIKRMR
jgi:hypothetical protein